MMRLLTNLVTRLDRAMQCGVHPRSVNLGQDARTRSPSLHPVGLDVRPGKLSWLIARAVTLQYR